MCRDQAVVVEELVVVVRRRRVAAYVEKLGEYLSKYSARRQEVLLRLEAIRTETSHVLRNVSASSSFRTELKICRPH